MYTTATSSSLAFFGDMLIYIRPNHDIDAYNEGGPNRGALKVL